MSRAQQDEVRDGGGAAVGPVDEVVGVAAGGRCGAPSVDAAAVAGDQRPAEPDRDLAGRGVQRDQPTVMAQVRDVHTASQARNRTSGRVSGPVWAPRAAGPGSPRNVSSRTITVT